MDRQGLCWGTLSEGTSEQNRGANMESEDLEFRNVGRGLKTQEMAGEGMGTGKGRGGESWRSWNSFREQWPRAWETS